MERTTAPTVLDGVQALHWLHAAAAEGPPSQGAPGPERAPPGGWLWPEPGTRWVPRKADVTKAHRRVKVLRKDWRFQVASLERMVGEQGRHIRHGQCPILLGTPGSPSAQGPLRTFPSSGLELRLCG